VIRFVYPPTTPNEVFTEGLKILDEVRSLRIRPGERLFI
jgi:hypothetical protein